MQRVIAAQRSLLDQRAEEIENAQTDQEERYEWLESYHLWLRNLPMAQMEEEARQAAANGDGSEGPSLYDRLCMMETSVLMQSQELKRTKRLFLRDKERLEMQLAQALEEVEGRDKIIKDRDADAESKVKSLLDMETELKGEIKSLHMKLKGQIKMINNVKEKFAVAAPSQKASAPASKPKPTARRGTTTNLSSTRAAGVGGKGPISPRPKPKVRVRGARRP